jgi:insertion element IS1 protein InsB
VKHAGLRLLNPEQVDVEICRADELDPRRGVISELDDMWAYGAKKSNPRGLWHALDHHTGQVMSEG